MTDTSHDAAQQYMTPILGKAVTHHCSICADAEGVNFHMMEVCSFAILPSELEGAPPAKSLPGWRS